MNVERVQDHPRQACFTDIHIADVLCLVSHPIETIQECVDLFPRVSLECDHAHDRLDALLDVPWVEPARKRAQENCAPGMEDHALAVADVHEHAVAQVVAGNLLHRLPSQTSQRQRHRYAHLVHLQQGPFHPRVYIC